MPRGSVNFAENRCKGCSLCVNGCPKGILALDATRINSKGYHPAIITDPAACIGCAHCAMMCPDAVIRVEKIA
ncbi:MAG: 4Fe-4S dicluster domain-containing protein [Spirochaetaceae bacterium]